ncbi:MAG: hypothetical protein A3D94_12210 [Alphaproteobacteria bacterium RIFCSPHIGHO2_12_FULL_66_14]|nr:MAG: hypothetical protein A3D94_12210 [Alphaproteobacteria bacterium RIFCSPHIGHO2_12_FULL_66_14]
MSIVRAAETTATYVPTAHWVEAPVQYLADLSIKPVTYNPPNGTGVPRRIGNYRDFSVRIQDARPIVRDLSLDRQAFILTHHDTAVCDFYDREEVRTAYEPEVEALIKKETGAAKVVVFDHTVRTADRAVERGLRAPVRSVHNDYTEKSGPQRVRDLLPPDEAEIRLKKRFAEYNVWRNIAHEPIEMAPLGFVDAESIAPRDLAVCDLIYADRTGEIYIGVQNADHRWYYFPKMTRDEAILIKCYDSMKDGRARFSLHSAFDDPTSPADPKPRQSIETRAFAFFD